MDYSLESLRDAFKDEIYKRSREHYNLYGILLATSLDWPLLLDYLLHYHELDSLTGPHILIIGPRLVQKPSRHGIEEDDLELLDHLGDSFKSVKQERSLKKAQNYLAFMQVQTTESYAFARYIGIPTSYMPAFVFFDSLDEPRRFVVWRLSKLTGEGIVRNFRHLYDELSEKCHWRLADRVRELRTEQTALQCSREVTEKRAELRKIQRQLAFFENVHALRKAFDKVKTSSETNFPYENVGKTLVELEQGHVGPDSFQHLEKYRQRWKGRMPGDYRTALENLTYPNDMVKDGRITKTERSLSTKLGVLIREVELKEAEHERYKAKREKEIQAEIQQYDEKLSAVPNVLDVLTSAIAAEDSERSYTSQKINLREFGKAPHDKPRRVFISYSHDSTHHKKLVLNVAQRLRADGVDCWIDQFEPAPAEGFPRWMLHQITQADFVLVICTETYARRFDGMEEPGTGSGVTLEGHLITQELHDESMRNRKFVPILLEGGTHACVPHLLRGYEVFRYPEQYEDLYRLLTSQPRVVPETLGNIKVV